MKRSNLLGMDQCRPRRQQIGRRLKGGKPNHSEKVPYFSSMDEHCCRIFYSGAGDQNANARRRRYQVLRLDVSLLRPESVTLKKKLRGYETPHKLRPNFRRTRYGPPIPSMIYFLKDGCSDQEKLEVGPFVSATKICRGSF